MFLNTVVTCTVRLIRPSLMPAAQQLDIPVLTLFKHVGTPAVLLATTLTLGNKAYLYLSVSLIQMIKAGMPMAAYITSVCMGMEVPRWSFGGTVFMMFVGVSTTITGQIKLSPVGLAFQGSAFFAECVRLVSLKRMLSAHGISLDPLSGLLFYAPVCFVTLFSLVLLTGEWRVALAAGHLPIGNLLANGALACGLNVATVFLLRKASATTLCVCGVLKDATIVVLSIPVFHNVITKIQVMGFAVTLTAVYFYNCLKQDPDYLKKLKGKIWKA
jgi:hypothetical protein